MTWGQKKFGSGIRPKDNHCKAITKKNGRPWNSKIMVAAFINTSFIQNHVVTSHQMRLQDAKKDKQTDKQLNY